MTRKKENGVATAIEAIYRDLEYARTLIKTPRPHVSSDDDDEASRDNQQSQQSTPERPRTADSWLESGQAQSDWSVISDQEDKRSSRRNSMRDQSPTKRSSLAAAVLSVLPDALSPSSSKTKS